MHPLFHKVAVVSVANFEPVHRTPAGLAKHLIPSLLDSKQPQARQDGAWKGTGHYSLIPVLRFGEALLKPLARGATVDRRKAKRNPIQVEIDIAQPGLGRCRGFAHNISRSGVSVTLIEGGLPATQRSVVLNFRVWTGNETLYRKVYARTIRCERETIAFEFAEHDFIAEAIVQDLMFYQSRERRCRVFDSKDDIPASSRPAPFGQTA